MRIYTHMHAYIYTLTCMCVYTLTCTCVHGQWLSRLRHVWTTLALTSSRQACWPRLRMFEQWCVHLSLYVSSCLSVFISFILSAYLYICLSVRLPIFISVFLSVCIQRGRRFERIRISLKPTILLVKPQRDKSLSWADLGALCYNPAANRLVVAHFSDWPKNVDDLGVKSEVLEHGRNHHEMMPSSALPLRTTILVGYVASLGSIPTSSAVPQPYFLFLDTGTGSEHESRESHVPRKRYAF
jgi:hypothetical protein